MNKNNRNAYIGKNVETLFKNSIGDNPKVIKEIQKVFNIKGRFLNAISTGVHKEKADVKIEFADGRNVDANVKAYKQSAVAYNQLTRTSIANFCRRFDLKCSSLLLNLFAKKAANSSAALVTQDKRDEVRKFLEPLSKEMVKWAFSYKAGRELLVVYERQENIFRIYSMKEVLKNIGYKFSYSKKGNVQIGDYIVFQRKGGNGVHSIRIKKTDPAHPGNNIQLKLKMKAFAKYMQKFEIAFYQP